MGLGVGVGPAVVCVAEWSVPQAFDGNGEVIVPAVGFAVDSSPRQPMWKHRKCSRCQIRQALGCTPT